VSRLLDPRRADRKAIFEQLAHIVRASPEFYRGTFRRASCCNMLRTWVELASLAILR